MNEMIKRKKDEGFTLIELMIVIAVIGILAVVLVPKMGSIKATAKSSGVDVNVRMVAANVQSRIQSWSANGTTVPNIGTEINTTFTVTGNAITNPISGTVNSVYNIAAASATGVALGALDNNATTSNALQIYDAVPSTFPKGGVVVVIPNPLSTGITITGYDANGYKTTAVTITP